MRELKLNSKLTIIFYLILGITSVYDIFYRGGEKLPRLALIAITILGLNLIYKKTFFKNSKIIYRIALFFIFISMYLANVWNFYGVENYDKMLHLLSGIILGFIGLGSYIKMFNIKDEKEIDIKRLIIFIIMFLLSIAGAWEIWEFTTDSIFGLTAQNGLNDTMWDMILGTLGGIIVLFPIIKFAKGKNVKLIDEFLKDI